MNKRDQKSLVKKYQCPGCVLGSDPDCGSYSSDVQSGGACKGHVLGTRIMGIGLIALGLPKGFNRPGVTWDRSGRMESQQKMEIRFSSKDDLQDHPWNKFNVAVWAMEHEGDLLVRTYAPRVNRTTIDVVKEGTLSLVQGALDVGQFVDEID